MTPNPPGVTTAHRPPRPTSPDGTPVSSGSPFPGQDMPVTPANGPELITQVFTTVIGCEHRTRHPEPCPPRAHIRIIGGHWIHGLDPDDLTTIAAKLRAQADHLDHAIRPALTDARTDWRDHFNDPYTAHLRAWEARARQLLLALTAAEDERNTG